MHYIDTDVFVLSVNTKTIVKDLNNLEEIFDFSNLDRNRELFSKKKNLNFSKARPLKVFGLTIVCLRSKMYAIKCDSYCKKN